MEIYRKVATEELQAYGALCLHRFCKAKNIDHPSIDELLDHLLKMLVSPTLDEWERTLAGLDLSGGGDPIPAELEARIPAGILDDFCRLVAFVVAIGTDDLYAQPSDEPLNDLYRCLEILDANQVDRPEFPAIIRDRPRTEEGNRVAVRLYSQEELEQVKSCFH